MPIRPQRPAIPKPAAQPAAAPKAGTYVVKAGDSLTAIARAQLGDAGRWKELLALNAASLKGDARGLRPGMKLTLPTAGPAQPVGPAKPAGPAAPSAPASGRGDRDKDGVADRYDAAPNDARNRGWNAVAAREYEAFVKQRTTQAIAEGLEIDCADYAMKMMDDFCREKGLPNPLLQTGKWRYYSPESTGGLPNVNGPSAYFAGLSADSLAKRFTKNVVDADGDGIAGFDRQTGRVDVDDLRPGDILFLDREQDGRVNHTVNIIEKQADGTVVVAYGTYTTTDGKPAVWGNLDLLPVTSHTLKPGSEAYERLFGPEANAWGVRRYQWMPDRT